MAKMLSFAVSDKLASCGAAKRKVMLSVEHRKHKGLNSRAESSHQPTRQRERQMKRFKPAGQAQRFLSAHDGIRNPFHLRRHHVPAVQCRSAGTEAFVAWAEIAGAAAAARLAPRPTILPRPFVSAAKQVDGARGHPARPSRAYLRSSAGKFRRFSCYKMCSGLR